MEEKNLKDVRKKHRRASNRRDKNVAADVNSAGEPLNTSEQLKKKNILIHPDRIEDLDERDAREKREAIASKETGYRTRCRVSCKASRWNWLRSCINKCFEWAMPVGEDLIELKYDRVLELKAKFVDDRVVTRCTSMFFEPKKERMYLWAAELKNMNRVSLQHLTKKRLSWLRRYGYKAELDMVPEPQEVIFKSGINPNLHPCVEFELIEETGKDRYFGVGNVYRMEPIIKW